MIQPHFYAPGLKLLDRPMSWREWAAAQPIRIAASEAQLPQDQSGAAQTISTVTERALTPLAVNLWGHECARGFVRDARFGSGQVIKGTNRAKSRKNRALSNWDGVNPMIGERLGI